MIHKSGKAKESDLKNKWITLIERNGIIKRIDLIKALGITIKKYGDMTGFILEEYEKEIEYNRANKRWYWIGKVEVAQEEEKEEAETLV